MIYLACCVCGISVEWSLFWLSVMCCIEWRLTDIRVPDTGISVLRSELDALRRERVELLGLIDGCYYHISLNEPYISDPVTGLMWMRYDRLKKLDMEIELKEKELGIHSEQDY